MREGTTMLDGSGIPRQYVKIKTLVGLRGSVKNKMLKTVGDTQCDVLTILRGLLNITQGNSGDLIEEQGIDLEEEIPLSIFIKDPDITDTVKIAISDLFGEIIFVKRLRFMHYREALRELKNYRRAGGKMTAPINRMMDKISSLNQDSVSN